jgi:hypothetical protein
MQRRFPDVLLDHRLDPLSFDCRSRQCRKRAYSAVGTADSGGLLSLLAHTGSPGFPLGCPTHWKLGNGTAYRYDDDAHLGYCFHLCTLYGYYWYPSYLW